MRTPRSLHATAAAAACPGGPAREGCYGLRPEDLHGAYSLPLTAPTSQTIAIVDAFDDPTVEKDLKVYDEEFGLPPCTKKNGCFTKVNQEGKRKPLPTVNGGWAQEIAMDVEMAHAICQNCQILLVEAKLAERAEGWKDLEAAEDTAAALGANEISNSWTGEEPATDSPAFDHPGIVITAGAGDEGYLNWTPQSEEKGLVGYPASSPHVVAVGGTRLYGTAGTWNKEIVWNGPGVDGLRGASGGGCSEHFSMPYWQLELGDWATVGCGSKRAVADIAADADPYTGAAVYDSTPNERGLVPAWEPVGGTSLATPVIAAAFALAGGSGNVEYPARTLYENALRRPASLHDIQSGSNGLCMKLLVSEELAGCNVAEEGTSCSGRAICVAGPGYDGPSGLGTPDGLEAFQPTKAPPKKPQAIEFTSHAPASASVGGPEYAPSAKASSGLAATFSSATPAVCVSAAGARIAFVGVGKCTVLAGQAGDGEYQPASPVEQSFTVAKGTQTITFTSMPPDPAVAAGPSYTLSAVSSSHLPVSFSSATPTVCTVEEQTAAFLEAGTCTIEASQPGNSDFQPAANAPQTFVVQGPPPPKSGGEGSGNAGTGGSGSPGAASSGTASFTASNPLVAPLTSFSIAAAARPDHRTGSIGFSLSLTGPGTLTWLLTFPNGSFGAVQSETGKCPKNQIALKGRCRSSRAIFARGSATVARPGTFALTARPSAVATRALQAASRQGHSLPVSAMFTFTPTHSGPPSLKSMKLLDRVTLAGRFHPVSQRR